MHKNAHSRQIAVNSRHRIGGYGMEKSNRLNFENECIVSLEKKLGKIPTELS